MDSIYEHSQAKKAHTKTIAKSAYDILVQCWNKIVSFSLAITHTQTLSLRVARALYLSVKNGSESGSNACLLCTH